MLSVSLRVPMAATSGRSEPCFRYSRCSVMAWKTDEVLECASIRSSVVYATAVYACARWTRSPARRASDTAWSAYLPTPGATACMCHVELSTGTAGHPSQRRRRGAVHALDAFVPLEQVSVKLCQVEVGFNLRHARRVKHRQRQLLLERLGHDNAPGHG